MNTEKFLTEEQITKEAGKRFNDAEGYNLWAIEAFEVGAKIALQLKQHDKGILNYSYIEEGYKWAVEKLFMEKTEMSSSAGILQKYSKQKNQIL